MASSASPYVEALKQWWVANELAAFTLASAAVTVVTFFTIGCIRNTTLMDTQTPPEKLGEEASVLSRLLGGSVPQSEDTKSTPAQQLIEQIERYAGSPVNRPAAPSGIRTPFPRPTGTSTKKREEQNLGLATVFVIAVAVWVGISTFAILMGDPHRLIHGMDSQGNLCGVGSMQNSSFLYYCGVQEPLPDLDGFPEQINLLSATCVSQCPTDGSQKIPCLSKPYLQENSVDTLTQAVEITQTIAYQNSYPTVRFHGTRFCVPVAKGQGADLAARIQNGPLGTAHQMAQLAGSFRHAAIFVAAVTPLTALLMFGVLVLISHCAGLTFLLSFCMACALTLALSVFFILGIICDSSNLNSFCKLNPIFMTSEGLAARMQSLLLGSVLAGFTVLLIRMTCIARDKIDEIVGLVQAASECIFAYRTDPSRSTPQYKDEWSKPVQPPPNMKPADVAKLQDESDKAEKSWLAEGKKHSRAMATLVLGQIISLILLFIVMAFGVASVVSTGYIDSNSVRINDQGYQGLSVKYSWLSPSWTFVVLLYIALCVWILLTVHAVFDFSIAYAASAWYFYPSKKCDGVPMGATPPAPGTPEYQQAAKAKHTDCESNKFYIPPAPPGQGLEVPVVVQHAQQFVPDKKGKYDPVNQVLTVRVNPQSNGGINLNRQSKHVQLKRMADGAGLLGLRVATKYHLGSLAYGSIMVTVSSPLRAVSGILKMFTHKHDERDHPEKEHGPGGVIVAWLATLAGVIDNHMGGKWNRAMYVDMVLRNTDASKAASDAAEFVAHDSGPLTLMHSSIAVYEVVLVLLVFAIAWVLCDVATLLAPFQPGGQLEIDEPFYIVLLGAAASAFVAFTLTSMLGFTSDVILYAFEWSKKGLPNEFKMYIPGSLNQLLRAEDKEIKPPAPIPEESDWDRVKPGLSKVTGHLTTHASNVAGGVAASMRERLASTFNRGRAPVQQEETAPLMGGLGMQ